jgi:hypothetical protein
LQLARAGSNTTTEDVSEDEEGEQIKRHGIEVTEADRNRKSAWGFLLERAQLNLMDSGNISDGTRKDLNKRGHGNIEIENDPDCSQEGRIFLSAILERVDRQCMAKATFQAFKMMQMQRPACYEGIKWMLDYWGKLSDLCGKDLTLGLTAAIAGALNERGGELKQKETSEVRFDPRLDLLSNNYNDSKNAASTAPSKIRSKHKQHPGLLSQELEAMQKDAQRLRTSSIFKNLDDGRTSLMVFEVDSPKGNVVAAWNQSYLHIFPDPCFLLYEGIARGCLPLYLLTTFVAHDDREAWLRMNLQAWSTFNAFTAEKCPKGKLEGTRERRLQSEFLKLCNQDGDISLYWVRFSKVEKNCANYEGDQRAYIVLRAEKVPFSRHIIDQPEKKKNRSKTNLFRQRPSQDLSATINVAAESSSLLNDVPKKMPGSGSSCKFTTSTSSFPGIASLACAPCTHLPVTSCAEEDSLCSEQEKNADCYPYPISNTFESSLSTPSNSTVPFALPLCSLSTSVFLASPTYTIPACLFDIKNDFLRNILLAAQKYVPGVKRKASNELQYSREGLTSLNWLQRKRSHLITAPLLPDGDIVEDGIEDMSTIQKPQQHTSELQRLSSRRPNLLLTLPSDVFPGGWELEQRTPPAILQRQKMQSVEEEHHLLLNEAKSRQQLFVNYLTQAMSVEQLQQEQLLYSLPVSEHRQYGYQSNIKNQHVSCLYQNNFQQNEQQRSGGQLTQEKWSQIMWRADSHTMRLNQTQNPAREAEEQPKTHRQHLTVLPSESQEHSSSESQLGALQDRKPTKPSPFKKRVGSGLYMLNVAAGIQEGETEKK